MNSPSSILSVAGIEKNGTVSKKIPLAFKFLQQEFGGGKRLRYLCQDETRLGLKTISGHLQQFLIEQDTVKEETGMGDK